jgi:ribosomal protein S18 acetylase RimI-like enzyme
VGKFAEYIPRPEGAGQHGDVEHLIIRTALETDLPEIAEIAAERQGDCVDRWRPVFDRLYAHARATPPEHRKALLLAAALPGRVVGYAKAGWFTPPADAPANAAPEGWYLTGVVVRPEFRRRGIGARLTRARLEWIAPRRARAYYFTNERNRVSIELHESLGFVELTRDFWYPETTFEGGVGVLFYCDLAKVPSGATTS